MSVQRTPPYPATHNMGTARMSSRPEDGVDNEFGRAHDVPNLFVSDGSVFTTGAAANPTLTIVALATPAGRAHCGFAEKARTVSVCARNRPPIPHRRAVRVSAS